MKNLSVLVVFLCCLFACKKEKSPLVPVVAECLEVKFEAFKQTPGASKIVRINRPSGALYWLVDGSIADNGEPVLNEQCEVVCTADCYCIAGGSLVLCDGTFLDFPQETIWER